MVTRRKVDLRDLHSWGDRDSKVFEKQDAMFKHLDTRKREDLRAFALQSSTNLLNRVKRGAVIEMFKDPQLQRDEVVVPQHRFFLAATYLDIYKFIFDVESLDEEITSTAATTELASVYEIIREGTPCHLYFDLEAEYPTEDTTPTPVIPFTPDDLEAAGAKFVPTTRVTCPLDCTTRFDPTKLFRVLIRELDIQMYDEYNVHVRPQDVVKLVSSYTNKYSAHIVVRLPDVAFASNQHMGRFLTAFVDKLYDKAKTDPDVHGALFYHKVDDAVKAVREVQGLPLPQEVLDRASRGGLNFERSLVPVVDLAVYTRNRSFRCMSASKLGKQSHLHIDEEECIYPFHDDFELFKASLICNTDVTDESTLFKFGVDSVKKNSKVLAPGTGLLRSYGGSGISRSGPSPIPQLDEFVKLVLKMKPYTTGYIGKWLLHETTMVYTVEGSRYCRNVRREHKSNGVYLVVYFQRMTYAQKCYDYDCNRYVYPERPLSPTATVGVRRHLGIDQVYAPKPYVSSNKPVPFVTKERPQSSPPPCQPQLSPPKPVCTPPAVPLQCSPQEQSPSPKPFVPPSQGRPSQSCSPANAAPTPTPALISTPTTPLPSPQSSTKPRPFVQERSTKPVPFVPPGPKPAATPPPQVHPQVPTPVPQAAPTAAAPKPLAHDTRPKPFIPKTAPALQQDNCLKPFAPQGVPRPFVAPSPFVPEAVQPVPAPQQNVYSAKPTPFAPSVSRQPHTTSHEARDRSEVSISLPSNQQIAQSHTVPTGPTGQPAHAANVAPPPSPPVQAVVQQMQVAQVPVHTSASPVSQYVKPTQKPAPLAPQAQSSRPRPFVPTQPSSKPSPFVPPAAQTRSSVPVSFVPRQQNNRDAPSARPVPFQPNPQSVPAGPCGSSPSLKRQLPHEGSGAKVRVVNN